MVHRAVAEDIAEGTSLDIEVGAAFFDQDAAGCVVAAGGVAEPLFSTLTRLTYRCERYGWPGWRIQRYCGGGHFPRRRLSMDVASDAIVCGECRERSVVGGEALPHFERGAIAIDGEIVQPDLAAPDDDRGGAWKSAAMWRVVP